MARWLRPYWALAWLLLGTTAADAGTTVVASIGPVHAIAAAVMEGHGAPVLLVPDGASEHTYVLRPSDARALASADVIIRVDPALETFLQRPIEALGARAHVVTLSAIPALTLYDIRADAAFEAEPSEDAASGGGAGGPSSRRDLHLWLDPRNAALVADELARVLGQADPPDAAFYAANAARFRNGLAGLEDEINAALSAVKDRPFIVFHDAYQYFERRFGLKDVGAVTLAPGLQPGARHLSRLRERIRKEGVACVFAEPQFEPKLVATLTEGSTARAGTLDPLGAGIAPGPAAYPALLRALAEGFRSCLAGPG